MLTAVAWSIEREVNGAPLYAQQSVEHTLAEMAPRGQASRLLVHAAASSYDAGEPREHITKSAAMAKLFCSDAAMRVTTDAVQVLGGYGYVEDYPAERYLREAKALQIVEGTNQVQRLVISRQLGHERHLS